MFRRLDSSPAQSTLPAKIKQRARRRQRVNLDVENLENRQLLTTDIWTGASSNLWSDNGNWQDNTAPTAGEDLVFPSSATNKTSVYDSGLGESSFGSIEIQDSGYDISASFAGSLTLATGLSATYGSSISNFDISFDPGNGSVSVGSGATLELGGVVGGTSGLSVSGGGRSSWPGLRPTRTRARRRSPTRPRSSSTSRPRPPSPPTYRSAPAGSSGSPSLTRSLMPPASRSAQARPLT